MHIWRSDFALCAVFYRSMCFVLSSSRIALNCSALHACRMVREGGWQNWRRDKMQNGPSYSILIFSLRLRWLAACNCRFVFFGFLQKNVRIRLWSFVGVCVWEVIMTCGANHRKGHGEEVVFMLLNTLGMKLDRSNGCDSQFVWRWDSRRSVWKRTRSGLCVNQIPERRKRKRQLRLSLPFFFFSYPTTAAFGY